MRAVGVRELKTRTSELLRRVRDRGEEIDVTYRGRTIARIVPVRRRRQAPARESRLWSDFDRLAREVGRHWSGSRNAADAVREGRRSL